MTQTISPEEWVLSVCERRGLDWNALDTAAKREILMAIPCSVRCWRVGIGIPTKPGEKCAECGRREPENYESLIDIEEGRR